MFTYDAASGLSFLLSQLTYIEARMYEVRYKDITYPNIIPVTNEAGPWVDAITYFYTDRVGKAKFIGSKALDVPIADIGDNKVQIPVELAGIGYEYSDEELIQAIQLQKPLEQRKANAARRAYEELVQEVGMTGDAVRNLPGFLNNENVSVINVIDNGSGTEWINKFPDDIIFDVNDFMGGIFVDTLQVERPDTLGLPTAQWNYIAGTPRASFSDVTILQWLVNNSPYLNSINDVIPMPELTGAGAGGTDRMIAYTKSIDKVVFHIPKPLLFTEPQRRGLGFLVPGSFKIAGIEFRYPASAGYADGI